jgi:hypothetical protein
VPEEQGIYRGEVIAIMEALADLKFGLRRLLSYIGEEDDGEAEEDV